MPGFQGGQGEAHPTFLLPRDGHPLEFSLQQCLPLLGDMVHQAVIMLLEEPAGTDVASGTMTGLPHSQVLQQQHEPHPRDCVQPWMVMLSPETPPRGCGSCATHVLFGGGIVPLPKIHPPALMSTIKSGGKGEGHKERKNSRQRQLPSGDRREGDTQRQTPHPGEDRARTGVLCQQQSWDPQLTPTPLPKCIDSFSGSEGGWEGPLGSVLGCAGSERGQAGPRSPPRPRPVTPSRTLTVSPQHCQFSGSPVWL